MTEPFTRPDVKILLGMMAASGQPPIHEMTPVAGLAGMPPTVIMTASLDPLRDQGRALASEIAKAGGEVVYLEAGGTIHGFWSLRKLLPSSASDIARCLAHLKLLVAA